jgi:hypothetical protein
MPRAEPRAEATGCLHGSSSASTNWTQCLKPEAEEPAPPAILCGTLRPAAFRSPVPAAAVASAETERSVCNPHPARLQQPAALTAAQTHDQLQQASSAVTTSDSCHHGSGPASADKVPRGDPTGSPAAFFCGSRHHPASASLSATSTQLAADRGASSCDSPDTPAALLRVRVDSDRVWPREAAIYAKPYGGQVCR